MRETDIDKLMDLQSEIEPFGLKIQDLYKKVINDLHYGHTGHLERGFNFEDCLQNDVLTKMDNYWGSLFQKIKRLGITPLPKHLTKETDPLKFKKLQEVKDGLKRLLNAFQGFEKILKDHISLVSERSVEVLSEEEKESYRQSIVGITFKGKKYPVEKWKDIRLLIGFLDSNGYMTPPGIVAAKLEVILGRGAIKKLNRVRDGNNPLIIDGVIVFESKTGSQGNAETVYLNPEVKITFATNISGKS